MNTLPWFPIGTEIPNDFRVGRVLKGSYNYQIVSNINDDRTAIVVRSSEGIIANETNTEPFKKIFVSFWFLENEYYVALLPSGFEVISLFDRSKLGPLQDISELYSIANAVVRLRSRDPLSNISTALMLPGYYLMPIEEKRGAINNRELALSLLTGGVSALGLSYAEIRTYNRVLTDRQIDRFIEVFGTDPDVSDTSFDSGHNSHQIEFSLPERPALEQFFRDYVIDPSNHSERYRALGVKPPNGILLYGPPGSGKSHIVRMLQDTLKRPTFHIDFGAVGSPYIHQTTVLIRKIFEQAKSSAPSLVVFEEIDAIGSRRELIGHDHKIEEVTELLRFVESASDCNILILATTNRRDAIDHAILRRGRFDHSVEVGYPSETEVLKVLQKILETRRHATMPNIETIARKLAGRPMSDIAWVVNEASRRTAQAARTEVTEFDLIAAIRALSD